MEQVNQKTLARWPSRLRFPMRAGDCVGVGGLTFESYLSDRRKTGCYKSGKFIPAGVSHGSILEPILFHISINDIVHDIQCDIKLFVATNITQLKF